MAKQSDNKVPKIRFKGFKAEWKENKLGELATFSKGQGYSKSDLTTSGTPIVLYGRLYVNYQTEISDVDTFVDAKERSIKSSGNEVIVPSSGETAEDIARASAIIKEGIILGGDLNIIRPADELNSCFLALNISNGKPKLELARKAQGKTVAHLRKGDLETVTISYPEPKEQIVIGDYFREFDQLIGLHQQKHDKLVTLKQAMLHKMFPKRGAITPEIRFTGFYKPWSEEKLHHFIEVSTEKNMDEAYGKEHVLSVSGDVGIVNQIEFQGRSFAGKSVQNYGVVKHGYIVYTKSPLKANPFGIIKTNLHDDGIVSTLYAIYKPKPQTDSIFVQYYFELDHRLNSYLKPLVNKGAKNDMKVSDENALMGKVVFPEKAEQQKIASHFLKLDELISKHAIQLEKLKQIKSACLERMFV